MKSLFTLIILLTGILSTNLLAQPWDYNFGTATGSHNTPSSTSGFLPDPPAGGGSDLVRVGDAGGGFALVNSSGSDSELQITASTGNSDGSINKFSVYDYTADSTFSIGFTIRFECDTLDDGIAYFFIGDGNYFVDAIRYRGSDLYTGIRWRKLTGDLFLQTQILNSTGDNFVNISRNLSLDIEYYVELFGNNTGSSIDYDYNSVTQTISAYSYDLWIDGSITTVDNRVRSANTMNDGDQIDSYMFLAEASTDTSLVMIVDSLTYSNQNINAPSNLVGQVFQNPLSVEMNWTDNSNNEDGFIIERETLTADAYVIIDSVNQNVTSYIDTNIAYLTYNYRVKAFNSVSQSAYSDTLEIIVPVELTSFTAALNGNDIDLQWQTATETNNSGFEILRFDQNDNYGWEKISFVPGHGTTTASKNYSFTDENVLLGIYSYRLKQIDLDGSFSYSEIIEVEVTAPLVFSLEQNYPNPFNPTTNIKFQIADFGSVSLKIYDVLGNLVAQLVNEEKEAGTYNYNWDASNLTSGIYFYILQAGDFIKTKKMILLK
jgi:hypothetical protein